MKFFTIGYGGSQPADLMRRLTSAGIRTVADVRLRPDRASIRVFVWAKTPDKGIERVFTSTGIGYRSLPELDNLFFEVEDWRERYEALMQCAGQLLVSRLRGLEAPVGLLCAERRVAECHRLQFAQFLIAKGDEVEHLDGICCTTRTSQNS